MNKIRLSVVTLNSISVIGLIIFLLFSYLQINNLKPPYGLDKSYTKFNLECNSYGPNKNSQEKIIFEKIKDLVKSERIVIINYNPSKMGLGVYDTTNKYENINLLNDYDILLNNKSYFIGKDKIKSLSGIQLNVIGYYDNTYSLFEPDTEYIYNIFTEPTLGGDFYIDTENEELTAQIFNIFREYNYTVNIYKTDYNVFHLLNYGLYSSCLLGIFFIYANLFLFYIHYCEKIKKTMKIHILYGAKFKTLVLFYLRNFMCNMMIGGTMGSLLYYILFGNSNLFNKNIVLISLLSNLVVNIILFLICLKLNKSKYYNLKNM